MIPRIGFARYLTKHTPCPPRAGRALFLQSAITQVPGSETSMACGGRCQHLTRGMRVRRRERATVWLWNNPRQSRHVCDLDFPYSLQSFQIA
jgi:hypothetical protein